MTRYLLQKLSRVEEETRMRSLPLDQPLNSYGLHTLLMTSESDRRIITVLEAAREEEETRMRSLPLDQPLNSYGLHTLLMTSESDRRIITVLEAAREEVLRSIDEKQELINNNRTI
nr:hypothetical protein [Tanacetum cinerariifolium]